MIRTVLVGVGGWGKNHARVLHDTGTLTAICDADDTLAEQFGAQYKVPYYTDVQNMLYGESFDAAIVATPTKTHFQIGKMLLQSKKHLLLEKPFTYEPAEGRELQSMAKKAGVILTCGYIERFNPAIQTTRNIIQDKTHGDIALLEFHRESNIPVHIKDVGIIHDTAVHDIDTANWLFDQMPQVVFARAGHIRHTHEDFATVMLGYADNRTAILACNWLSPVRSRMFRAALTDAIITGDFITRHVQINDKTAPVTEGEPLKREIDSFLEAIKTNSEPVVTAHQAISVSEIAKAALLSSQRGVPIYLDLR